MKESEHIIDQPNLLSYYPSTSEYEILANLAKKSSNNLLQLLNPENLRKSEMWYDQIIPKNSSKEPVGFITNSKQETEVIEKTLPEKESTNFTEISSVNPKSEKEIELIRKSDAEDEYDYDYHIT